MNTPTPTLEKAIVCDTPDSIEYYKLASWKGMVKLQAKGMKHSTGVNVKARVAEHFGLSARAKPEAVLAKIEARMEFILQAKAHDITAAQLTALIHYVQKHGKDWKERLGTSWINGGDHGPELQKVRNTNGPKWLAAMEITIEVVG